MNARRSSTLILIAIILLLVSCVSHQMRSQKNSNAPKVASKQVTEGHQLFHGPLVVTAPAP